MKHLTELMRQDDTVIFVGSGVSRWAGLPGWEELIEELAAYLTRQGLDPALVRQEARDGDLLQAASYGLARLTKPQFGEFVRSASRSGIARPALIHEAIMNLGPSCFITTNYDDLLEQAYRRWRSAPAEPRVVTNRQLTEQADIVHAQARHFIFKPHGDARDSDSIILAREQYRELYPGGSRNATLETLKTLLPSRPILYLGFGLRDPDFLYVRDLLANLYRGGTRDHYAIVPDPVPEQIDYWRTHFGVHLVGYATLPRAGGGRDHGPVLDLLRAIRPECPSEPSKPSAIDLSEPSLVLELARYASSNLVTQLGDRFPIRVASAATWTPSRYNSPNPYDYWTVSRFLREGPDRAILIGAPGAGKSFAVQEAVNAFASALQDACLQGQLTAETDVPVRVDLKLYTGDLRQQIEAQFPPKLSLTQLIEALPVKLFLDGYNELPRECREDGSFDRDLDTLLADHQSLRVIICSRTSDGLDRLDFPVVELDEIPLDEVERRLGGALALAPAEYRKDIIEILQRPFYFRLLEKSSDFLVNSRKPADLYAHFIDQVRAKFEIRFGAAFDLVKALEHQAYSALEHGVEAFALSELSASIMKTGPEVAEDEIEAMINWLVSADLLIPSAGGRGAFVHQSVTEYLAARALVERLGEAEDLANLIALRRWDNAIYLAISMLDGTRADRVLQQLVESDLKFALEGARYVESDRDILIEKLLGILLNDAGSRFEYNIDFGYGIGRAFERLPFSITHESSLRLVERQVAPLQAGAVRALAQLLVLDYKPELISMLLDGGGDSSPRAAADALASLLDRADIRPLVDRMLLLDLASLDVENGATHELVAALAVALKNFSPEIIREETIGRLPDLDDAGRRLVAKLVCDIYMDSDSSDGLAMVVEVMSARLVPSIFPLFLMVKFNDELRSRFLQEFDKQHLDTIISYIDAFDRWAVDLLKFICSIDSGIARSTLDNYHSVEGDARLVVSYCATGEEDEIFSWIQTEYKGNEFALPLILEVVDLTKLDWHSRHGLFVELLSRRDLRLANALFGGSLPVEIQGLDAIDLTPLASWLEWLLDLVKQQDDEGEQGREAFWASEQLSFLIARSGNPNSKSDILQMFDNGETEIRWLIATKILPNIETLSMDDLSAESVSFLVETLKTNDFTDAFRPNVLAIIATEKFLRDQLFPLAITGDGIVRGNIVAISHQVGKRLGIRFKMPFEHISPSS